MKGYVLDYCFYLKDLAGTKDDDEKKQFKKDILSLFVSTATIEVVSASHPKKPKTYPLSEYLTKVGNYSERYKFVALQFMVL